VEAKYRAEEIEARTEGLAALVGDGVQGLKQKDIEAILKGLTERLHEMAPGLPEERGLMLR
jgi:hypothetical protein